MIDKANAGSYKPRIKDKLLASLYRGTSAGSRVLALLQDRPEIIDISFYQITANFETARAAGIKGVIIRAGQNNWPDLKANGFMTDATSIGIPFGSYWYYDSRRDPREQAKLWSEVLAGFDTKLWCWADYEENYGGPFSGWRKFYDFLEYCKEYMPDRKFGIYTGYYYWIGHSPNPTFEAASLNYFKQYPLWLAWYADWQYVRIPKPWDTMVFWQKTDSGDGKHIGVGSLEVDLNDFIGTLDSYNELFNVNEENEGGSGMNIIRGTVIGNVRLRQSPAGAVFSPERFLLIGDVIEASGNQAQWLRVTKINGVPTTTETWASAGANEQYIRWDWITIPDPDPEPVEEYILHVKDGVTRKFIPE